MRIKVPKKCYSCNEYRSIIIHGLCWNCNESKKSKKEIRDQKIDLILNSSKS